MLVSGVKTVTNHYLMLFIQQKRSNSTKPNKGQNSVDQVTFHLKVTSEELGSDGNSVPAEVFTFIFRELLLTLQDLTLLLTRAELQRMFGILAKSSDKTFITATGSNTGVVYGYYI